MKHNRMRMLVMSMLLTGLLLVSMPAMGYPGAVEGLEPKYELSLVLPVELRKTPDLFGPIKHAYMTPFVLVYGTIGDEEDTAINLEAARYQSVGWVTTARGRAPIIADIDVTAEIIARYNLILFGGPNTNAISARVNNKLPVRIENNAVVVGEEILTGPGLAMIVVYPNPLNQERYIVLYAGTDREGTRLATWFRIFKSHLALPDFVVFDAKAMVYGWAGFIAAGFFDTDWQVAEIGKGLHVVQRLHRVRFECENLGSADRPAIQEETIIPTIEEEIIIPSWLVVGPFQAGTREYEIDFLIEHGGTLRINPVEGMAHSTELVPGGLVHWQEITTETKTVSIPFDVDFTAKRLWHGLPSLYWAGYAYAEFESDKARRALVDVGGRATRFWINGVQHHGERTTKVPVLLQEGTNRIMVRTLAYVSGTFTFRLLPVEDPIIVNKAILTAPDLIIGQTSDAWVGITVVNTTNQTVRDISVTVGDGLLIKRNSVQVSLPPLAMQKVTLPFQTYLPVDLAVGEEAEVPILVSSVLGEYQASLKVTARSIADPIRTTFLSKIDRSAQQFSLLYPKNFDPDKEYALIIALHGAGVWDDGKIRAYTPKDWAFVVAPLNRHAFGFDWQDWGRLDMLEVLREMKTRYPMIDVNRIYLTGHSMGGHGVWHIATIHPDLFAAIAPSAGWSHFKHYVPEFLRRDVTFGTAELMVLRHRGLFQDQVFPFLLNLKHVPAFVLHGEKDGSVLPDQARRLVAALRRLNYDVTYLEVPEMGHWWDDPDTPGVDTVDHAELMAFLQKHVRNPNPPVVVFRTNNISVNNRAYWLKVVEPKQIYSLVEVRAEAVDNRISLDFHNVAILQLHLTADLVDLAERVIIEVNGNVVGEVFPDNRDAVVYIIRNRNR